MGIRFDFDLEKAFQVINYLKIKLIEDNKILPLDKLSVNKLLFYADLYHINNYGRFICGGHYVAMDLGPVHSEVYDLVKGNNPFIFKKGDKIETTIELNSKKLSRSDREALDKVVERYGNMTSIELSELSHKEAIWLKYHVPETSVDIPSEEFVDSKEYFEYIKYWNTEFEKLDTWLMSY